MRGIPASFSLEKSASTPEVLSLKLAGDWLIDGQVPSIDGLKEQFDTEKQARSLQVDSETLASWDTTLLVFFVKVKKLCEEYHISLESSGLPPGARQLLRLASAVPAKKGVSGGQQHEKFLFWVGDQVIDLFRGGIDLLGFVGEATISFGRLLRGKAGFRRSDLAQLIEECGVRALPIVSLISVLVGLILAFVGAIQLEKFGAQIYVADLVGIAMVREMGAMMAGIIMAGRTGAAFAAQLGTMQVNEEIDALSTMGISAMDFLVLPRMIALVLMMPLLCIYADLMGILGGVIVSVGMLDITLTQYFHQTVSSLDMTNVNIGIFKSVVYGVIVALSGCLRGMQCGRSASAVGLAATSAVVTAIVAIVVSDGIFAVICNALGI